MIDDVMISPWVVGKWSCVLLTGALLAIGPLLGNVYIAVAGLAPCVTAMTLAIRGYMVRNNAGERNAFELGRDAERLHAVR